MNTYPYPYSRAVALAGVEEDEVKRRTAAAAAAAALPPRLRTHPQQVRPCVGLAQPDLVPRLYTADI